jgi:DNA mismatch repair protein MutS2
MVKAAKQLAGEDRGKLDRLILHMEEELQQTHRLLEEAEIKESRLSGLVKLYQDRLDELQESGEERKQEILQEAEDVLQEANATMEQLVREIRQQQASREAIRAAKERLQTQKKNIQKLSKKKKVTRTASFKPGDWVVWEGHRGRGEIVSEPDSSGRLLVQWDGFKLRVPASALKLTDGPKAKRRSTGFTSYSSSTEVSNEIDLRGMTALEALEAVERYLSDAVLAGFNQVGIIHGKGTGVLRREVGEYLKGHPRVKNQRLGNWNEGDTGVTIVELK